MDRVLCVLLVGLLSAVGGQYSAGRALSPSYGEPLANGGQGGQYQSASAYSGGLNHGGGALRGGYQRGGYGGNGYDDANSEPANYEFSYEVSAPEYGVEFGHEEQRQGEQAWGKYQVVLPDGRRQIVDYTADEGGFKPTISYEETGYGANGYGRSGNGNGHGSIGGNGYGSNGGNGYNRNGNGYGSNGANGYNRNGNGYGSKSHNGYRGGIQAIVGSGLNGNAYAGQTGGY